MTVAAPITIEGNIDRLVGEYLAKAAGDPMRALQLAIGEALLEREEAERRAAEQAQLISRGFIRGGLPNRSG